MSNGQYIDILSPNALEELKKANEGVIQLVSNISNYNKVASQANTPLKSDGFVKQVTNDYNELEKSIKRVNSVTQSEIVLRSNARSEARLNFRANTELLGAYSKLSAQVAVASRRLQDLKASTTATNTEIRKAQKEFDVLQKRVLEADRAVGKWNRTGERSIGMFRNLLGAFGIAGGVTVFASIAKDVFDQTKELNAMNNALKAVSESEEIYAKNKMFLSDVSDRYGLSLKETTKQYTSFYAASKEQLSLVQLQNIFRNISKASGVLGLSVEQTEGAFRALEQMLSKGNVQAEEIRGQLSERLPGAFNILAKSMGVTTQQLNKLLENGEVLAKEVLPKFAEEYAKSVGADQVQRVETLIAAQNRLSNSWTELIEELNNSETNGLSKFFGFFINGSASLVKAISEISSSWDSLSKKAFSGGLNQGRDMFNSQLSFLSGTGSGSDEDIAKSIRAVATRTITTIESEIKRVESQLAPLEKKGFLTRILVSAPIESFKERLNVLQKELGKAKGMLEAADEFLNPKDPTKQSSSGTGKSTGGDPWAAVLAARLRYLRALSSAEKANFETGQKERQKEIDELEKFAKNEQNSYQSRLEAYGKLLKIKEELLADSLQQELLLIEDQRNVELAEAEKAERAELKQARSSVAAQAKIREYYAKEVVEINNRYDNIGVTAKLNNDAEYIKIVEGTSKAEIDITKKRNEALESTEKAYRDSQIETFKAVSTNEKLHVRIRQEAFRTYMALRQKQIDIDKQVAISNAIANQEDLDLVIARFKEIQRVFDKDYNESSPFTLELKRVNAELKSMKDNILNTFFSANGFASIKSLTDGTFKSLIDGFDLITKETQEWGDLMDAQTERFLKKFQAVFGMVSQITTDTYKFINSQQEKDHQLQLGRLESQYQIDLALAGDNTAAKEDLEEKYDRKRRQLERARAKQERENAIFEAIINTASAVVAALPNIALSAFVGLLGAAQIAMIHSTPLPQYYKGREGGKSEWAVTQERGAEAIIGKDGRVKSTGNNKGAQVTWLDAGDKVLTATQTKDFLSGNIISNKSFNNALEMDKISQFGGVSLNFDYDRLAKAVKTEKPEVNSTDLVLDHRGLNMYVNRQNQRQKIHNASLSNKAIKF